MPISDLHKKKLKTNFAILAAILGFVALIAAITIVKLTAASS
jgi:hypothetical protein